MRYINLRLLTYLLTKELTCKYNSMLTYIPVSFWFSFKNVVPVLSFRFKNVLVRVKNSVRVRVSSRVRV